MAPETDWCPWRSRLDHVFSLVYPSLIRVWSESWFLEAFARTANLASTVVCLHFTSCECANVYLCGVMWPLGRSGRPGDAAAGRRSWHQHRQHHQKLHQIAQITTARAPRPSTAQHWKHTRARYHLLKGSPCPPQLPSMLEPKIMRRDLDFWRIQLSNKNSKNEKSERITIYTKVSSPWAHYPIQELLSHFVYVYRSLFI